MDRHSVADDRLATSVAFGALTFLAVAGAQLSFDQTPGARPASACAAITAVVLAGVAWTLECRPWVISSRTAPVLVTAVALLIVANPLIYIVCTRIAYPSIGMLLGIVGIGALVPYPRIALLLVIAVNVVAIVCALACPPASVAMVALQLIKADVLALVIAVTWRRTERRLGEANALIARMAVTDDLTGLLNRRGLTDRGQKFLDDAVASGHHVVVAFIDVNNLKGINDRHGHAAGDALIAGVGGSLRWVLDAGGLAARVGGDEFALIARGDIHQVTQFQRRVEGQRAGVPHFGISIGWAYCAPNGTPVLAKMFAEADRMMLYYKRRPS